MYSWEYETRTFITNWNEALIKRSIPTIFFPLTAEERWDYFNLMFSNGETEEQQKVFKHFTGKIAPAFEVFTEGVFLRNDRRSPKDSESFFTKNGIVPALSPQQAVAFSLYSERTYMDLKTAIDQDHLPVLVVRKWMEFEKEREFRCFVRDGNLIGISQYYHSEQYDRIVQDREKIQSHIEQFYGEIKEDLLLLGENIVFDVYDGKDEMTLIETNPYGMSDPCCFTYDELDSATDLVFHLKQGFSDKTDEIDEFSAFFSQLNN